MAAQQSTSQAACRNRAAHARFSTIEPRHGRGKGKTTGYGHRSWRPHRPGRQVDMIHHVLVYGTLRRGGSNHALLTSARFLRDRKSTRLNSSHVAISYAVFCLKKKNNDTMRTT